MSILFAREPDPWNDVDGARVFYVSNPGQGLWAYRGDFADL